MAASMCGAGFTDFLSTSIFPITAYGGILMAIIIGLSYMAGEALRNPKLSVWAKTEVVQIGVSLASLFILLLMTGMFCTLDMGELADLFGITYTGPSLMFDAAEGYLKDAALYAHNSLTAIRYHLEGYMVLGMMGKFECDYATGNVGWGCWFGYSGSNLQPYGGYAAQNAALGTMFASALTSCFFALNYLMILLYIYKGFAIFLFPIGIFLRSVPYMRSFGSLLIAIAISFTIIYPFFLAVFNLMGDTLFNKPHYVYDESLRDFLGHNEDVYAEASGTGASLASAFNDDYVKDKYFPNGQKMTEAIAGGGVSFVVGVFLPSAALLAAIASVTYLARIYGEEIDLSRIMQMI